MIMKPRVRIKRVDFRYAGHVIRRRDLSAFGWGNTIRNLAKNERLYEHKTQFVIKVAGEVVLKVWKGAIHTTFHREVR